MKKLYFHFFAIFSIALLAFASCKKNGFLSATAVSSLNKSSVFIDSAYTNDFLAQIYSNIGFDVAGNQFGNGGMDASGDESQANGVNQTDANYWATGTINAAQTTTSVYTTCYTQIRAVNQLLANISQTKISVPAPAVGSKVELIAEAKFLRAWYYFILLKHYGGVVLVGDKVYTYTDNIPSVRSTYAATVKYITSQCDTAALILPITQSGNFYGRASAAACMALKARVLLYAASPLFSDDGTIAGPTPFSTASATVKPLVGYLNVGDSVAIRWRMASNAAAAIINTHQFQLCQGKGHGNGFSELFSQRGDTIKEYILQWMLPQTNYGAQLEACWDPPTRGGSNGAYPYQETVDVFPMKDGKAITDNTSAYTYNAQNPYVNRDPRMNYSIIHDQTVLPVRASPGIRSPVDIYQAAVNGGTPAPVGLDALGISGATTTGYYTNKMLDTNATSTAFNQVAQRCQPMIRFAEILLDFAEAKNEYAGPGSVADSVYQSLISIRKRAGIDPGSNGLYGLQANMTQAQMRTAIQLERRLELSYEGFRFWDVRRWKIAPTEENKQFHGMTVTYNETTKNGNITVNSIVYSQFAIAPLHTFSTRMYLWPIPQSEVGKSAQLLQNPGY